MSTYPPLDERERSLLSYLAVKTVAVQAGADEDAAADALDELAGRGEAAMRWNATDAWLLVAGHVIVHAARDWLHFMAHRTDPSLN